MEGSFGFSDAEEEITNALPSVDNTDDGTGLAVTGVATAYWNMFDNFNIQAGVLGEYYDIDDVSSYGDLGAFAMLGYMYKF